MVSKEHSGWISCTCSTFSVTEKLGWHCWYMLVSMVQQQNAFHGNWKPSDYSMSVCEMSRRWKLEDVIFFVSMYFISVSHTNDPTTCIIWCHLHQHLAQQSTQGCRRYTMWRSSDVFGVCRCLLHGLGFWKLRIWRLKRFFKFHALVLGCHVSSIPPSPRWTARTLAAVGLSICRSALHPRRIVHVNEEAGIVWEYKRGQRITCRRLKAAKLWFWTKQKWHSKGQDIPDFKLGAISPQFDTPHPVGQLRKRRHQHTHWVRKVSSPHRWDYPRRSNSDNGGGK